MLNKLEDIKRRWKKEKQSRSSVDVMKNIRISTLFPPAICGEVAILDPWNGIIILL